MNQLSDILIVRGGAERPPQRPEPEVATDVGHVGAREAAVVEPLDDVVLVEALLRLGRRLHVPLDQRLLERLSIRWWEQIFLILLFFSTIGFLLTLITLTGQAIPFLRICEEGLVNLKDGKTLGLIVESTP